MRRRILQFLPMFVVLSLFAACAPAPTSPTGQDGEGQESQAGETTWSVIDPISVTISLDEKSAQSALIGPAGGVLSTTAADGTGYTLDIPAGALSASQDISLIPLSGMDGLPLSGGLVGAVDLAPNGLELSAPATLTIQAAGPVEAAGMKTVGLAYTGEGEGLHLYPFELGGSTITLQVYHFSGYGGGQGTPEETRDMGENHSPDDPQDQMNNEGAEIIPGEQEKTIDFLHEKWRYPVEPTLKKASTNEAYLNNAYATFQWWLRWMDNADVRKYFENSQPNLIDQGYALLAAGVENALDKAYQRCESENKPGEVVDILHWIAFAERDPRILAWLDIQNYREQAVSCASFEIEFNSEVRIESGPAVYKLSTERIRLTPVFIENLDPGDPIDPVLAFQDLEIPLVWEEGSHPAEEGNCEGGIVALVNSTLTIEDLSFDLGDSAGYENITLRYNPGIPVEEWEINCGSDPVQFQLYQWLEIFCEFRLYRNELEPAPLDCFTEDSPVELHAIADTWDVYGSGQPYAEVLYDGSLGGFYEVTRITLYHAPGQ